MKDLTIKLNDLLKINNDDLCKFKLHLAAYNGNEQPLDVFARDFNEWIGYSIPFCNSYLIK